MLFLSHSKYMTYISNRKSPFAVEIWMNQKTALRIMFWGDPLSRVIRSGLNRVPAQRGPKGSGWLRLSAKSQ
jgi:hypothetical protein